MRCDLKQAVADGVIPSFQSTHLVWGATLRQQLFHIDYLYFNPRTSCEVRQNSSVGSIYSQLFQSTHLVWGATCGYAAAHRSRIHFNPRTSCEVRPGMIRRFGRLRKFQSTHLVWGATFTFIRHLLSSTISIHAPRVRCDPQSLSNWL